MSHLYPSIPTHKGPLNAGEYAELELLQTLERGLSDAYTLFHSVDWSRGVGPQEQHGEIDIVIINQAGEELVHMDVDPPTEITRKGDAILDEWAAHRW